MAENKVAVGINSLVGKKQTKIVDFLDNKVQITKLSLDIVTQMQDMAKEFGEDNDKALEFTKFIIREGVEGGKELTDQEFMQFPADDLNNLALAVMKFSGMAVGKDAEKKS